MHPPGGGEGHPDFGLLWLKAHHAGAVGLDDPDNQKPSAFDHDDGAHRIGREFQLGDGIVVHDGHGFGIDFVGFDKRTSHDDGAVFNVMPTWPNANHIDVGDFFSTVDDGGSEVGVWCELFEGGAVLHQPVELAFFQFDLALG